MRMCDKRMTIFDLMKTQSVCIPLIQRDYAQGRSSEHGVREGFVRSLIECVMDKKKSLPLDFIYGPTGPTGNEFIPLDGQQRLTTLFLFAWYFGLATCEWRFEYMSRRKAMNFVEFLLRDQSCRDYVLQSDYDRRKRPSVWLRAQSGFVPVWEMDPSVRGMIAMLDEIWKQAAGCLRKVTDEDVGRVYFYRHLCDPQVSPDETYLKINARGERLTEWENVKSILDARAEGLSGDLKDWKEQINGSWQANVERFLPGTDEEVKLIPDQELPYYIALCVELSNAAFRNIVDLSAMMALTEENVRAFVLKRREVLGSVFDELPFGEAVLGLREDVDSIKGETEDERIKSLTAFLVRIFHDHQAAYSDYKNVFFFPEVAFSCARESFNALSSSRERDLCFEWPVDRSENALWERNGDFDDEKKARARSSFTQELLFSNANPSGASLDETERGGFKKWLEGCSTIAYSAEVSTYRNDLRFHVLSMCAQLGETGRFAATRALNLLDSFESVDAENFIAVRDAVNSMFEIALSINHKEVAEKLPARGMSQNSGVWDDEMWKIREWKRHKAKDLLDTNFGKAEKCLGMMFGQVEFTRGETDYEVERAEFFAENFGDGDPLGDGSLFIRLLEHLPESDTIDIALPQRIPQDRGRQCSAWRRFMARPEIRSAFSELYSDTAIVARPWLDEYKKLVVGDGWPYARLKTYSCYGDRIFAYSSGSRMSSNCVQLSFSDQESEILAWLAGANTKTEHPRVIWGNSVIDVAGSDCRQGVNYDAIFSGGRGKMQKFRIADEGGWEKEGVAVPFASYDELKQLMRSTFKGLK